jgi:hypothetical protein
MDKQRQDAFPGSANARVGAMLQTQNQASEKEHDPTGEVTRDEIEFARQDVRCTVDANLCLARHGNGRFSKNEGIVSAREG